MVVQVRELRMKKQHTRNAAIKGDTAWFQFHRKRNF